MVCLEKITQIFLITLNFLLYMFKVYNIMFWCIYRWWNGYHIKQINKSSIPQISSLFVMLNTFLYTCWPLCVARAPKFTFSKNPKHNINHSSHIVHYISRLVHPMYLYFVSFDLHLSLSSTITTTTSSNHYFLLFLCTWLFFFFLRLHI